jgi:hypothetical protein
MGLALFICNCVHGRTVEMSQENCIVIVVLIVSDLFVLVENCGSGCRESCARFFFLGGRDGKHVLIAAVPAVRKRCDTMGEDLILVFKNAEHLKHTSNIESPLIIVGDVNACH